MIDPTDGCIIIFQYPLDGDRARPADVIIIVFSIDLIGSVPTTSLVISSRIDLIMFVLIKIKNLIFAH